MDWHDTLVSLPDAVMHFAGIVAGYLFWHFSTKVAKAAVLFLSVAISIGYVYGMVFYFNKLNYGTSTGRLTEQQIKSIPVELQDKDGANEKLIDFPESYLLFDFWSTRCGVCYRKFPQVQALHDFYAKDGRVGVYGVHSRMEDEGETVSTGNEILVERAYTFPNLSIDMEASVLKELGVDGYPTVLIFDRDRSLIFRGSIEFAEKFIAKQLSEK